MPDYVLTKEQRAAIKAKADDIDAWRDEADLERRRGIALQFRKVIDDSGVAIGKEITSDLLCQLISMQWQIQNLNPVHLPQLVGTYPYKVHFANFQGSVDDLKAASLEKLGTDELYAGADLSLVSDCIRRILSDSHDSQAKGASDFHGIAGAGQAIVSGFLFLIHETAFGLVNAPTKSPFLKGGLFKVTRDQRTRAYTIAKASLVNATELSGQAIQKIFRYQVFLTEVKEACGFKDFHEVDQFLLGLAFDAVPDAAEIVQPIVDKIPQADVELRRQSEAKARDLVAKNLGGLSKEQMQQFLSSLNSCLGKNGDVATNRFGPGTLGHNANQIVEQTLELGPWIRQLWESPIENIPLVLNEFWQQNLPGVGRLFPTAILYLRDNEQFSIWTKTLDLALHRAIPGLPSQIRSGFGYLEYCKGVQRLGKLIPFPAEMHDWVLFWLMEKSTPKPPKPRKPKSQFMGFTGNTYDFMRDLASNNNQTWFDANRVRFKDYVDKPLRALVQDLGIQVFTSLDPSLEVAPKTGKCISRIRKNVWGKKTDDVYQDLYWAAFYRKERTKQTDCQFFMSVRADRFQYGVYFGEDADDVREELVKALNDFPQLGERIFDAFNKAEFLFSSHESETLPEPTPIGSYAAFVELVNNRFHVYRDLTPQDTILAGHNLVEPLGDDFRLLYPLFLMAASDNPGKDVPPHLEHSDSVSDDVEISIADLAEQTLLEEKFFEQLNLFLEDKQQLVFSGPPGTSKTYIALEYARYLSQGSGEVRTVQFHPSYGYEDFIEGLRPVVRNGSLVYDIEDGVFKQLCNAARSDKNGTYVLLVDEINRGNLPRIFGELLFLLERREETTILPYSKKPFSIPGNVIILGTMNTSDRSIALMDLALRRRFHFKTMPPRPDILGRWLKANKKPHWVKTLFDQLNKQLSNAGIEEDRLVGHAHFMSDLLDQEHLSLIWDGSIYPMLRELFYTEPKRLKEFALEKLMDTDVDEVPVELEMLDPTSFDDMDDEDEGGDESNSVQGGEQA